jgi:hypothetical protein
MTAADKIEMGRLPNKKDRDRARARDLFFTLSLRFLFEYNGLKCKKF